MVAAVKRPRLLFLTALALWPGEGLAGSRPTVETILERVEARGQSVNDIRCKVVFTVVDRIADDKVERQGEIIYKKKSPNPLFMITFNKTVQEGVVKREKFWYLFDGRWFIEATERARSIIKRDIAPPGTEIDLFSIEKAPFPIPFGQKKDDILAHFDVTFGAGGKDLAEETDHLICTPKQDSRMARDYHRLEFFVCRSLHLPRRIVMTTQDGAKITTADFPDLSTRSINTKLADSLFRMPPETKKYAVSVER